MNNKNFNTAQAVEEEPGTQTEPGTETPPKKKQSRGFNARIGDAELLAEAMLANSETLTPGGGGEEFVNEFKALISEIKQLNQEQEKYKGDLKKCTENIQAKMKDLNRFERKGRRIVKNEIPPKRWVEFGITATR